MDADAILQIRPQLTAYLHEFDGCMGRVTNRTHLETYVSGQLSDLDRKSVEPIADAAGVPPRTLQEFLSLLKWDEPAARDRLQRRVAARQAHPHAVGVIDETSFPKQGRKTAGVQRQHCGSRGKLDNCVVTVHLGYVAGDFHTLLDGDLYLPEKTWHDDRPRCRAAGIPDTVVYRPKWKIALEQIDRALGNGVRFAWLTFDEGYGGKPPFLQALDGRGQNYVAEIPTSFVGWTRSPEVLYRAHARDQGQEPGRQGPRLKVRNTPAAALREILKYSPVLRAVPWEKYRIKEGSKGPLVWEAKRIPFWIKDEKGLPSRPHHLIVARNVLKPEEVKFFLSNAPPATPLTVLLLVAFSRWHIERLFEDSKTELGLDHFEVRTYRSLVRHLIVTCISHLFLAEFCLRQREKKSGADGMPGADGHPGPGAPVGSRGALFAAPGRGHCCAIGYNATAERCGPPGSSPAHTPAFTRHRDTSVRRPRLQVAEMLAL